MSRARVVVPGATRREGVASTPFAVDTNMVVAGLLSDLAAIQDSKQRQFGYKQAASAIRRLDEPLEALRGRDGTLRRIPRIGPASTRVILEVLDTAGSATVEREVALSPQAADVAQRRRWRSNFLSRARVRAVLEDRRRSVPAGSRLHVARQAVEAGCLFALDSDAHGVHEWRTPKPRSRTPGWPACPPSA